MTAVMTAPRPVAAPPSGRSRARLAHLERPLLLAGLALVALHLLDLALSGPDTSFLGVLGIVAVPAVWALAQPHVTRPTRLVLGVVIGLLTFGFAVVSHGLHVVNSGPAWTDVTGMGMIAGGLLLIGSGLTAIAAPRRAPRRPALGWRLAHGAGWLAAVPVFALLAVMPFSMGLMSTHAPRWAIQESSLGIPHQEVAIDDRGRPHAFRRGTSPPATAPPCCSATARAAAASASPRTSACSPATATASSRSTTPATARAKATPTGSATTPSRPSTPLIGWLARRPDVDPQRIAGFGSSLGAEVLLEAAAGDPRLRAVIGDGPARPRDAQRAGDPGLPERVVAELGLQVVRGVSGMQESPSLVGVMPRIAPRPVLLIAGGGDPNEIPTNRGYRDAGGSTVQLWELPDTGHTAGLRTHPVEYERRTTTFLDRALGLKETP